VPFLLAALVVLGGAAVVMTLRPALGMADTFEHVAGPPTATEPEIEALTDVPTEPEDAILAEHMLAER
jgi:hypothetical protein